MNNNSDLYREILANGPSPGTILLLLSQMKDNGEINKVIQEGIKALKVYPSDIYLRKLLAEAYLEDGQISMAENEFDQIAGQINDLVLVYKSLARLYLRQRRIEEARETLRLFSAHHPDDNEAFELLASLITTTAEDESEAIPYPSPEETTELLADRLPDIATPTLAEIYVRQGQILDAVDIYERIVSENPDDDKSLERLDHLKTLLTGPQIKEEPATGPLSEQVVLEYPEIHEPSPENILLETEEISAETIFHDPDRRKKEKMISTLEKWLGAIQERTLSPWPGKQDTLNR